MKLRILVSVVFATFCLANSTLAQTTSFTYQGKLTDVGNPANGSYDLQFALFDSVSGGSQIGSSDLGLIAEEVAAVEPRLVTHNLKGEIELVKYDHLSAVLIHSVKEQQAMIEAQQKQIAEQHSMSAALLQTNSRLNQRLGKIERRLGKGSSAR